MCLYRRIVFPLNLTARCRCLTDLPVNIADGKLNPGLENPRFFGPFGQKAATYIHYIHTFIEYARRQQYIYTIIKYNIKIQS